VNRLRRLATSLSHTHPRQIAERVRLLAKRRVVESAARVLPLAASLDRAPRPALRADLPPPLFPPREDLVVRVAEKPYARILERTVSLSPRIDWRWPRELPGTRLDRLTLHYHEWAEALDDAEMRHALSDWIEENPPYATGYWRDAWSSYAVSIRAVVWLQQIAARRGRTAPEVEERYARSLAAQLRFLAGNLELDIGGNHLVRNVKALLWAGRSFEGAEAQAWGHRGVDLLERDVLPQVLPDGVHFERSPAYHSQVLADLLECMWVLPEGEARDRLKIVTDRMTQALVDLTHPDGLVSLFNDGGLHMAYSPTAILAAHRKLGGAWITPRPVAAFRDAGYFTARSGEDLVVVDCGRLCPDELPAHAHGDALAFEWTLAGQRIVVDAGVYEYQGPMRAWSRATRSHNTLTLDDLDQAEFWGEFRMARRPGVTVDRYETEGAGFRLRGAHDGYRHLAGSPIHERRFDVRPDRIAVDDVVRGGLGQAARARLLLHPDVAVEQVASGLLLSSGPARAILSTTAALTIVPESWAPDFGVRQETKQVVLDYGRAPCEGSFTLERAS
jgi:uncharacterized heparinase superfamily protein